MFAVCAHFLLTYIIISVLDRMQTHGDVTHWFEGYYSEALSLV